MFMLLLAHKNQQATFAFYRNWYSTNFYMLKEAISNSLKIILNRLMQQFAF